jgi:hypothetical protein
MTEDQDIPARVHVVLRQECGRAIIIRRGPSNHVCSIGWDLKSGEFQLGQWLKGRIYERRCDLSLDGRHWLYFAMNGHWQESSQGSWTAVARWPWLKAMQFFPKGDCWGGGGLFTGDQQFWLNEVGSPHQRGEQAEGSFQSNGPQPTTYFGGECPGVYTHRLQREGWNLIGRRSGKQKPHGTIFERVIGSHRVMKTCIESSPTQPGRGCYWDQHELIYGDERRPLECDGMDTWRDRVFWVRNGSLHEGALTSDGLVGRPIKDFNAMTFEAIEAPY